MDNTTMAVKAYLVILIEGVFEDGSTISTLKLPEGEHSEQAEHINIETVNISDKLLNNIEKSLSEERVLSHFRLMEKLSNNQQSAILIRYYVQKIKRYITTEDGRDNIAYFGKKLVCTRKHPYSIKIDKDKPLYYVYKHYYFDKNHNEVVFYVGKGMGDAKGNDSRIYSDTRNRYWKAIVEKLEDEQISYYFEPVKFFDSETEALNYELQLQKEYWDKGQCLGCADLRRRYGYLEDEVIE